MFTDRVEAGHVLGQKLVKYKNASDVIVVAIPRGGVVVGHTIARDLSLPLDVIVVKKLGAPGNPELAIGAVCADGTMVVDRELVLRIGVNGDYLKAEAARKKTEAHERLLNYRSSRKLRKLAGKTVILTDDGVATGATVEVAIKCLKKKKPAQIILAIPVAPRDTIQKLATLVDEILVLKEPDFFGSVGQFYNTFGQVDDEEVKRFITSE